MIQQWQISGDVQRTHVLCLDQVHPDKEEFEAQPSNIDGLLKIRIAKTTFWKGFLT